FVPYTAPRPVGGAFGSAGSAIGEGTLLIRLPHGPISFANVMLVPELGVNLLSMTRMMMAGVRFSNTRKELTIADEEGQLIATMPISPTLSLEASRAVPSSAPPQSLFPWSSFLSTARAHA
ncbi:hypothetical protein JCM11641_007215, partial [Rhodosporidiobolus odoratus]